jgi:hypothetical protein
VRPLSRPARTSTVGAVGPDADAVGRKQELAQISGLLERCARRPAASLLKVQTGTGKSTLCRAGPSRHAGALSGAGRPRPVEIETKPRWGRWQTCSSRS